MKKLTKKQKEEIEIKSLEETIEREKIHLDRLIKTIVKHTFIENCTGSVYYEDLYHGEMKAWFDLSQNLSEKERMTEWMELMFGTAPPTKIEGLQNQLKRYEKLVSWVKCDLNMLSQKKKEEIIRDTIEQQNNWSDMCNEVSKLNKRIEKMNGIKVKSNNQDMKGGSKSAK